MRISKNSCECHPALLEVQLPSELGEQGVTDWVTKSMIVRGVLSPRKQFKRVERKNARFGVVEAPRVANAGGQHKVSCLLVLLVQELAPECQRKRNRLICLVSVTQLFNDDFHDVHNATAIIAFEVDVITSETYLEILQRAWVTSAQRDENFAQLEWSGDVLGLGCVLGDFFFCRSRFDVVLIKSQ